MAHVSVHYKIYLPAGHHRQPRNASAQIEPNPPSEVDVATPGNITPLYIPQIPYTFQGKDGLAQLLFWSVTDGTTGQVLPAGPLTQTVGSNPLTITAWYYPVGGPDQDREIILDAFSAIKGDFIDDTFVAVTSNPSLTNQANVVGVLSTSAALTLKASANVSSTAEPFNQWMSFNAGTATLDTLSVPANANGVAIAVYQTPAGFNPILPPGKGEAIYGTIIGGVAVDGGGWIIVNGHPHPVDPWGPLVVRLVQNAVMTIQAKQMDKRIRKEIIRLATEDAVIAVKEAIAHVEHGAVGK